MDRETKYETALVVARFAAGLLLLMGGVAVLGWAFRSELSRFGAWFVDRFGVLGIVAGTFLADGVHFPVPPQFYILTGIAGGHTGAVVLGAVTVGSELGGAFAFAAARAVFRHSVFVRERLAAPRLLLQHLIQKSGYAGLLIAMLLPVGYSALCMASGAMGLPFRAYAVLGAMRVPRLLLSYALIVFAWHATRG